MYVIISFNCVPDVLNICTFTSQNVKSSTDEIATLCGVNDIVLLHQHWLTNDEVSLLSSIDPDFMGSGISSVDPENVVHIGCQDSMEKEFDTQLCCQEK